MLDAPFVSLSPMVSQRKKYASLNFCFWQRQGGVDFRAGAGIIKINFVLIQLKNQTEIAVKLRFSRKIDDS